MKLKKYYTAVSLVILILLSAGTALAHKVNIFAYVEGGKIYTESYFPDGRPVEGGTVVVFDSKEKKLLKGKTDKEGFFSFPIPNAFFFFFTLAGMSIFLFISCRKN